MHVHIHTSQPFRHNLAFLPSLGIQSRETLVSQLNGLTESLHMHFPGTNWVGNNRHQHMSVCNIDENVRSLLSLRIHYYRQCAVLHHVVLVDNRTNGNRSFA
jgi:hypothetical protein